MDKLTITIHYRNIENRKVMQVEVSHELWPKFQEILKKGISSETDVEVVFIKSE